MKYFNQTLIDTGYSSYHSDVNYPRLEILEFLLKNIKHHIYYGPRGIQPTVPDSKSGVITIDNILQVYRNIINNK